MRRAREAVVCTGSSPQVCGFPERRRLLEPTRAAIVRMTAAIARLDPAAASLPARWTEGPLRRGAGDAALVDAVVGQVTRCVPDDVFVDASSLGVWVARAVYGPGDAAVSSLAVGIPAPRLAPERLRQAARRALLVTRRHPCR